MDGSDSQRMNRVFSYGYFIYRCNYVHDLWFKFRV